MLQITLTKEKAEELTSRYRNRIDDAYEKVREELKRDNYDVDTDSIRKLLSEIDECEARIDGLGFLWQEQIRAN